VPLEQRLRDRPKLASRSGLHPAGHLQLDVDLPRKRAALTQNALLNV